MDLVSKFVPVIENLKPTAHFIFEKRICVMDFSNSCRQRAYKIFDPSLVLHWICRAGSDKEDLRPSQMPCADWWKTKQPSHGDLRILACPASLLLGNTSPHTKPCFSDVCKQAPMPWQTSDVATLERPLVDHVRREHEKKEHFSVSNLASDRNRKPKFAE